MTELFFLINLLWQPGYSAHEVTETKEAHVSIRTGATLKEALIAYGKPTSANEEEDYLDGSKAIRLIYSNDVCVYGSCTVLIKDGKVAMLHNIKPEFSGF